MHKPSRDTLGLLSFVALFVFAASFLLSKLGANMGHFAWLGSLLLLIVVLVLSYEYSQKLTHGWQITYFVIAVLSVIAFVWGFF